MRCLYCTLDFIYFIFFCIVYRVFKKKKTKKKKEREGKQLVPKKLSGLYKFFSQWKWLAWVSLSNYVSKLSSLFSRSWSILVNSFSMEDHFYYAKKSPQTKPPKISEPLLRYKFNIS